VDDHDPSIDRLSEGNATGSLTTAMSLSRRQVITALGLLPPLARVAAAEVSPSPGPLPDPSSFPLEEVYLDAAFTHPFGRCAKGRV
jgi:hypothetical protein